MYTYVQRDFKTAKPIEELPGSIYLSTPAMVGSKIKMGEKLFEVKELAHNIAANGYESTNTILYIEKIW